MTQTFIFQGEKPARLNIQELIQAVQAVQPGVKVTFYEQINHGRWPYTEETKPEYLETPDNIDLPYTQPDVLIFENVPDQYTRAQVRNFILNHAPAKTTEEERSERLGDRAVDILMNASDAKKAELIAWLGV